MRRRRRSEGGPVTVTGPGVDRSMPCVGAALGFAQSVAMRHPAPDGTWYVRNGSASFAVIREPKACRTERLS